MATRVSTEELEKQLESMLEIEKFPPPEDFRRNALVTDESMYEEAQRDLEGFWSRQAKELID
jgi:acetyl-CoA synthetase